jgi:GNAT superfamily N-acetyltransferase
MPHPFTFWRGVESTGNSQQQRFLRVVRSLVSSPTLPFRFSFATLQDAEHLQEFLQANFAAGSSKQPRLVVPLCPSAEELVLQAFPAADAADPAGCIRFKKSGFFEGNPIHLIDAFCVHPTYRKRGLATALLTTLHVETQARGMLYSLFLKEGAALPISHPPLYSSTYLYCRVGDLCPADLHPLRVLAPSAALVNAYIKAYQALRPETFVYWDPANPNQMWRLWREGHAWLLLCVQDAYQEIPNAEGQNERIGWMTALLESPGFVSDSRRPVVLDSLLRTTPYPWIWTDRVLVGDSPSAAWRPDGPFHWYSYGWTTCLRPSANYVLVV